MMSKIFHALFGNHTNDVLKFLCTFSPIYYNDDQTADTMVIIILDYYRIEDFSWNQGDECTQSTEYRI
mgnify:CR=1 FL=1